MHLVSVGSFRAQLRLPHTRGDAPRPDRPRVGLPRLTPHAWGCTPLDKRLFPRLAAYPTRVGMHPARRVDLGSSGSLPHTRGDAPPTPRRSASRPALTPHAWGCTALPGSARVAGAAYPTRVGMHPRRSSTPTTRTCLPHTRGDAPRVENAGGSGSSLTPHAWGCTRAVGGRLVAGGAYPTRVGMHPRRPCPPQVDRAYPTRVGMHRRPPCAAPCSRCLPHTRGDAPRKFESTISVSRLTPHAWGCTQIAMRAHKYAPAYPTRVGMHRIRQS